MENHYLRLVLMLSSPVGKESTRYHETKCNLCIVNLSLHCRRKKGEGRREIEIRRACTTRCEGGGWEWKLSPLPRVPNFPLCLPLSSANSCLLAVATFSNSCLLAAVHQALLLAVSLTS